MFHVEHETAPVMRALGIVGHDGGSGKTTTAVTLATLLAQMDRRTLLVDAGEDGRATNWLLGPGLPQPESPWNPREVGGQEGLSLLRRTPRELLADSHHLTRASEKEDFLVIDFPPMDQVTGDVCRSLDGVIITCRCEDAALQGLARLLGILTDVWAGVDLGPRVLGVLITMADRKLKHFERMLDGVIRHFPIEVFPFAVPRDTALKKRPDQPGLQGDLDSRSLRGYVELAMEVLAHE